jgi:CBS domain-containing membrane protein
MISIFYLRISTGGNFISAVVGVAYRYAFRHTPALALGSALSVATAISAMQMARVFHPPSAATALIATLGLEGVDELGFFWVRIQRDEEEKKIKK